MALVLDGTNGVSGVDGTASNPAIEGTDSNTGIFYPAADTVAIGTGGTERLRVDSSGNVGIGTTSPTAKLDVSSGGLAANFASSTAFSGALWKSSTTTGFGRYIAAEADVMTFGRYGVTENMRIDSSGNVGIGTSSPGALLNVNYNSASFTTIKISNSVTGNTSSDGFDLVCGTSGEAYVYNRENQPLIFGTNNTERMRITSAGDVGIGTSSPAQKLHISGAGSTYTSVTSTGAATGAGAFYINNTSTWLIGASPASGLSEFAIIDQTSGSNVRMRIDSTGFTQFPGNLVMPYQGAPTSKAGAATLSGAELITGILNTTGTTYTITLPTGANIESALTWFANNVSLDWYVINTASGTITIGANGNTTLGSLTIATGTSAHFRIRRTAANTFTVYRL